MKANDPAGPGRGVHGKQDRTDSRIVPLIRTRPKRTGILKYRQQRTPADICAAITNALDREARLARATGMKVAPEVLEDISAWVGRGCLP